MTSFIDEPLYIIVPRVRSQLEEAVAKIRGLEDGLNDVRNNMAKQTSQPHSVPEPKYSASTVVRSQVPHISMEQTEMVKVNLFIIFTKSMIPKVENCRNSFFYLIFLLCVKYSV